MENSAIFKYSCLVDKRCTENRLKALERSKILHSRIYYWIFTSLTEPLKSMYVNGALTSSFSLRSGVGFFDEALGILATAVRRRL